MLASEVAVAESAPAEFWLLRPAVDVTGAEEGGFGTLGNSPLPAMGTLSPDQVVAVARMYRFAQKVQARAA